MLAMVTDYDLLKFEKYENEVAMEYIYSIADFKLSGAANNGK